MGLRHNEASGVLGGWRWKRTPVGAGNYNALISDIIIGKIAISPNGDSIFLPTTAAAGEALIYVIKDETGTAGLHPITIVAAGGETIDGLPTYLLALNYGVVRLYVGGGNWWIW